MKLALKLSLLANVVLATVVCHPATRPKAKAPLLEAAATRAAVAEPFALRASQPHDPPSSRPDTAHRFDWRELEAPDYPTYIANLRAINCPEQTVRDIITADVASLFALKREGLAPKDTRSRWSPAEEAGFVASLLGEPGGPQPSAVLSAEIPPGPPGHSTPQAAEPVRMPLVFQTQALASLRLSDEQREELGELAQQFIQEIGGLNQNPSNPAYRATWLKSQPKFDGLIVNVIGRRALVDLDQAIPAPEVGAE
jgi:hypothetical protein